MFDDVEFRYRMPDGYDGHEFQSKSLDCTGDQYVVTPEGRLHRRYCSGYPNEVRQPLGELAFDGELNVYVSEFATEVWHEYDLIFAQRSLREIKCHQTGERLVFEPCPCHVCAEGKKSTASTYRHWRV